MTASRRGAWLLVAGLALAAAQETAEEPSTDGAGAGTDGAKPKSKDEKSRKELAEGKSYCEYDNCYELLGVQPDAGPIPSEHRPIIRPHPRAHRSRHA